MTTRPPPQLGAAQLRSIHSPLYSLSIFLLSLSLILSLSQSSPESPSSSLPLLPSLSVSFARSIAPYLRTTPPPFPFSFAPFLPELSATGSELCEEINRDPAPRTSSDAVEEDKGTHPDVPFALLPAPYDTYSRIRRTV